MSLYRWFFPLISIAIFMIALSFVLMNMASIEISSLVSFSAGLLAYAMMLTVTFMGSRPRPFEKKLGLPEMYEVHAQMSMVAFMMIIIHMIIQFAGFEEMLRSPVTQTGYLAVFSILIVMFTGIFSLSGTFVNDVPKLRKFKETFMKREVALWLHRFAIVAIIAVYAHLMLLPFLNENTAFVIFISTMTFFVLTYYFFWKLKNILSPQLVLVEHEAMTKDVWRLVFEGEKLSDYQPGDYYFIRFKNTPLSKEGHPFSLTSIPSEGTNRVEFMIKESGDWTNKLSQLSIGSAATLEGPYGNYVPKNLADENLPLVLLSGGIGVTPNLSLARKLFKEKDPHSIHFVWGLASSDDLFLLDELQEMANTMEDFHLHIIFSDEEVEGYDYGFVSEDYLVKVGANLWQEARFFCCGPPPMLNAVSKMLEARQVDPNRIHIDEFGF